MKRRFLSGLVIVSAVLVGCSPDETIETAPVIRPAKLVEVETGAQVQTVSLPAIVGAADSSILTFQVSGLLEEITLVEGTEVQRGQVLAQLDPRDFRNSVASARATYDNALAEFERAERLITENAISRSILDERRSDRDVARASLDSALKQLDDTTIRAPFSGVVADIHVESFENVGAQQAVLTLQSAGDAEAIVQVPASLVINSERLQPIDIFLELDAAPGLRMPAAFVEAASAADSTTQTFEARFGFTPPDDLVILPGMTGLIEGRFESTSQDGEEAAEVISVPLSAILSEAGETYTWLVDMQTMTVSKQQITVGPGVGEAVRIVAGLEDGDVIVGAGGAYLYEGSEIRAFEE
ncbi:MAG: efflux RND transporter periplasmic adaptor subunit [Pseudomonadota bacterium]